MFIFINIISIIKNIIMITINAVIFIVNIILVLITITPLFVKHLQLKWRQRYVLSASIKQMINIIIFNFYKVSYDNRFVMTFGELFHAFILK